MKVESLAVSEQARIDALVLLFRRKLEAHKGIDCAKRIVFSWHEDKNHADLDVRT